MDGFFLFSFFFFWGGGRGKGYVAPSKIIGGGGGGGELAHPAPLRPPPLFLRLWYGQLAEGVSEKYEVSEKQDKLLANSVYGPLAILALQTSVQTSASFCVSISLKSDFFNQVPRL